MGRLETLVEPGRQFSRAKGHIAISGTGRAGTTLLVKLLHRAGLETGFSEQDLTETEQHVSRAGLEIAPSAQNAGCLPDVIKSPALFLNAGRGLSEGWLKIDLLIVPVRDIDQVLKSRSYVTQRTFHEYFTKGMLRGGFVGGMKMLFRQREATLNMFHANVSTAVKHDIPMIFLDFPRFARDEAYFVSSLHPVLSRYRNIDRALLAAAHRRECNPDLVRAG